MSVASFSPPHLESASNPSSSTSPPSSLPSSALHPVPNDPIVLATLRLSPFASDARRPLDTAVASALSNISKTERRKVADAFHTWVRLNASSLPTPPPFYNDTSGQWYTKWLNRSTCSCHKYYEHPVPSQAALVVHYLLRNKRQFSPLIFELSAATPFCTLRLLLPLEATRQLPRRLVRPNISLQTVFWHFFSAQRTSSRMPSEADVCGFVTCGGLCGPQLRAVRGAFHLERVYQRHTAEYQATLPRTIVPSTVNSRSPLLRLPSELLMHIAQHCPPTDFASFVATSPVLAEALLPVVPGLRLRLFAHQTHALRRMLAMETLRVRDQPVPLLSCLDVPEIAPMYLAVDMTAGSLLLLDSLPTIAPPRGGLFCDEPGLGKTITALSLILKTAGQMPNAPPGVTVEAVDVRPGSERKGQVLMYREHEPGRFRAYGADLDAKHDRVRRFLGHEARQSTSRRVRQPDFFSTGKGAGSLPMIDNTNQWRVLSRATLIIVPFILVDHWMDQIRMHVDSDSFKVLMLASREHLNRSAESIARRYDVVVASTEVIRTLHEEARDSAPSLLRIHFLRIIVDEGHSLSNSASITQFTSVCNRLRAERRWIMTGTPTPNTLRSDVDHLFSLLSFIRDESYGLDQKAWEVGIRAPYTRFHKESLDRLGLLLKKVMIRADKSILKTKCHVKNVILDFSAPSALSYNGLVRTVRRNLITADWFTATHKESLLNKVNISHAMGTMRNLRLACNLGGTMNVEFHPEDVVETLDMLYDQFRRHANINDDDRFPDSTMELAVLSQSNPCDELEQKKEEVLRCEKLRTDALENGRQLTRLSRLSRNGEKPQRMIYVGVLHEVAEAFLNRSCTCACCGQHCTLPIVTPCAHLLCDECIIRNRTSCVAKGCEKKYRLDSKGIPEDLIELQPSAGSAEWLENWDETESAKIEYLVMRLRRIIHKAESQDKAAKILVHSQYVDHLRMLALRLKVSDLTDRYVEMSRNERDITTELRYQKARFIAQYSVNAFKHNPLKNILLMDSKYGAVGLDLSFVENIFLLEPVWDASVELQIISRAHRIGCKQDIFVERLVMRDSVEEVVMRGTADVTRTSQIEGGGVAEDKAERDFTRVTNILRNLKIVYTASERRERMSRQVSGKRVRRAGDLPPDTLWTNIKRDDDARASSQGTEHTDRLVGKGEANESNEIQAIQADDSMQGSAGLTDADGPEELSRYTTMTYRGRSWKALKSIDEEDVPSHEDLLSNGIEDEMCGPMDTAFRNERSKGSGSNQTERRNVQLLETTNNSNVGDMTYKADGNNASRESSNGNMRNAKRVRTVRFQMQRDDKLDGESTERKEAKRRVHFFDRADASVVRQTTDFGDHETDDVQAAKLERDDVERESGTGNRLSNEGLDCESVDVHRSTNGEVVDVTAVRDKNGDTVMSSKSTRPGFSDHSSASTGVETRDRAGTEVDADSSDNHMTEIEEVTDVVQKSQPGIATTGSSWANVNKTMEIEIERVEKGKEEDEDNVTVSSTGRTETPVTVVRGVDDDEDEVRTASEVQGRAKRKHLVSDNEAVRRRVRFQT